MQFQYYLFSILHYIAGIIESLIKYHYHPLFWKDPGESDKAHYFLYYRILVLY